MLKCIFMINDSISDVAVFLRLVGQRVAVARERRRLTERQLADRSGVPITAVGALERGEQGVEVDDLQQIADVLGVDITDLLPAESEVRATSEAMRAGRG